MPDLGVTHIALPVSDPDMTLAFYARYADMDVVHRRRDDDTGHEVLWLSDHTRPFVLVLVQVDTVDVTGRLGGMAHVGVACRSRAEVEQRCSAARAEGREVEGPHDEGPPVGYWAFVADPDGHNLELSFGQEVGRTVQRAGS